jgi:hypothetical protein
MGSTIGCHGLSGAVEMACLHVERVHRSYKLNGIEVKSKYKQNKHSQ